MGCGAQVDAATAQEFATSEGIDYIETSAKNSTNVEDMFRQIAVEIQQRYACQARSQATKTPKHRWLPCAASSSTVLVLLSHRSHTHCPGPCWSLAQGGSESVTTGRAKSAWKATERCPGGLAG